MLGVRSFASPALTGCALVAGPTCLLLEGRIVGPSETFKKKTNFSSIDRLRPSQATGQTDPPIPQSVISSSIHAHRDRSVFDVSYARAKGGVPAKTRIGPPR